MLWCSTAHRQRQLPTTALRVGPDLVSPSLWARDLGIFVDADLSMRSPSDCRELFRHVETVAQHQAVSPGARLPVACCTGNITLIGIPAYQVRRLQSVMNAAARSIASLRRSDHITDTLVSLHWLRSSEGIQYKLATTVFQSLHGLAPPYLSDDLHRLVDIPSLRRLRSASSLQLDVHSSSNCWRPSVRCCRSDALEQSTTRHY